MWTDNSINTQIPYQEKNSLLKERNAWRSINENLEKVVFNDFWDRLILVINRIKALLGLPHFITDPEMIISRIDHFVSERRSEIEMIAKINLNQLKTVNKDPELERLMDHFCHLLPCFSRSYCDSLQETKVTEILDTLNFSISTPPPRSQRNHRL